MARQQVPLPATWEGRVNLLWTRLHTLKRPISSVVQQELQWRDREAVTTQEIHARDKVKLRCLKLSIKVTAASHLFEQLQSEYRAAGYPPLSNGLNAKWNGMEPCVNELKAAVAPLKNGNH